MLESGVHPTVAGVLLALAVPLRHRLTPEQLQQELRPLTGHGRAFEQVEVVIRHLEGVLDRAHSPLHSMEHALAPYVAFVVMPVFAFANAGVALGGSASGLTSMVALGAGFGLLLGKPIGVAGGAWVVVRTGLARLPAGASWPGVIGVGLLAGIGFTMALFVADLAFGKGPLLDQAKIGVLTASVLAALLGLLFLSRALPRAGSSPATVGKAKAGRAV